MKQPATAVLLATLLSVILPAFADGHFGGGRSEGAGEGRHGMNFGRSHWEGARDIRHFEDHHLSVWRSGGWRHGSHDGRFGWWWIAAGMWYFYPAPIYPYPDPYVPPVLVVPQPLASGTPDMQPPAQNWYYCEASKSYYPYVPSCPAGWKVVPATPSAPITPPVDSTASPGAPSY